MRSGPDRQWERSQPAWMGSPGLGAEHGPAGGRQPGLEGDFEIKRNMSDS